MRLKHYFAVRCHGDTIAISQSQGLVVVQHTVEILNPDCIHRTVQNNPDMLPLRKVISGIKSEFNKRVLYANMLAYDM